MKRFNFLSVAFIAVLMVFAVSCTTLQESAGGYEDMPRSQAYRQVPYGSNQVIVVERDPFTGQYYQVSPFGYYGSPYNNYGYGYPGHSRLSNRGGYYRGNQGGSYRGNNSGGRVSQGNNQALQKPQPQSRSNESTQSARDILKGN